MPQAQGQRLTGGIYLEGPVQGSQQLLAGGTVEALQGAVALGVLGPPVDQPCPQRALYHLKGVGGDEPGASVQVQQLRQPMLAHHLVKAQ